MFTMLTYSVLAVFCFILSYLAGIAFLGRHGSHKWLSFSHSQIWWFRPIFFGRYHQWPVWLAGIIDIHLVDSVVHFYNFVWVTLIFKKPVLKVRKSREMFAKKKTHFLRLILVYLWRPLDFPSIIQQWKTLCYSLSGLISFAKLILLNIPWRMEKPESKNMISHTVMRNEACIIAKHRFFHVL